MLSVALCLISSAVLCCDSTGKVVTSGGPPDTHLRLPMAVRWLSGTPLSTVGLP